MLEKLFKYPYKVFRKLYYKAIFSKFGKGSYFDNPLRIDGPHNIKVGVGCWIQYKTWLAATNLLDENVELIIEDGCTIGHFNHIIATKSIVLHENVLTADRVYISDNIHGYEDINLPISKQPVVQKGTVEIGEGSWIGENVCVLGAKIGKHCVIGSNSVVTRDIPDFCVAVGVPAKVIKQYDFEKNEWVRVI